MFRRKSVALSLALFGALSSALTACNPSHLDLVDDLSAALEAEPALEADLAAKAPTQGDAGSDALVAWNHQLGEISSAMDGATEGLRDAKEEDLAQMRASLDSNVKLKAQDIIHRDLSARVLAPSWRKAQADAAAAQALAALGAIRSKYAGLFNGEEAPAAGDVRIEVVEDDTLADNRAQCMEAVFAFARGKSAEATCLEGASRYCGHQMDMACVSYQISAAHSRGLGCSQSSSSGTQVEASWLADVSTCRSPTPVPKSPSDPVNTVRQSCILAVDAFATGLSQSGRCLMQANVMCQEATSLSCITNLISTARSNHEGCLRSNNGYDADATWLGYMPSCN